MVAVVDIKLHCLRSPARGEKVRNDEMGFTGQGGTMPESGASICNHLLLGGEQALALAVWLAHGI